MSEATWCTRCTARLSDTVIRERLLGGYSRAWCGNCTREVVATHVSPSKPEKPVPTDYRQPVAGSKAREP